MTRDLESGKLLTCQKAAFNLPAGISYLNCAYMAPLSKKVSDAGVRGLRAKELPYQIAVDAFFQPVERLKRNFSILIGNADPARVALMPSASYGMAVVTNNLMAKPGGNIVLPEAQFPSNVYAYHAFARKHDIEIRTIKAPLGFERRAERWNHAILEAIDARTNCVAISVCQWSDGTLFDLIAIREKTNRCAALLVIDGTQSIGALPFSIEEIRPDALICACYKFLMGPYGFALGYFGPAFDLGEPIEYNWYNRLGSDDFRALVQYEPSYRPGAARYDVGECANFVAVPMMNTAIEQILDWTVAGIQDYCSNLVYPFLDGLRHKGYRWETDYRACHLLGIYLPASKNISDVKTRLEALGIVVSYRGNAIRISPHLYNDKADFDRLLEAL